MTYTTPPTADEIAQLAERALAELPSDLRRHVAGVPLLVKDAADDDTLAELQLDSPWELTGLYRGVPLHLRNATDVRHAPDTVVLFREAILLEWIEEGEDLYALVRNVVVHEVAHHFGFSDADIARLERDGRD